MNKENSSYKNTRLSIQLSLNGLSFCITDTVTQTLLEVQRVRFSSPIVETSLKEALGNFLEKHGVLNRSYESVVVVHTNSFFNIVPLPLFNPAHKANYVKYNTQVLPNDEIAHDPIENQDMVVVYIPFTSANNFIFDHFGPFDFKHHSSLHLEELLQIRHGFKEIACYLHLDQGGLSITVIKENKLLFFNHFGIQTTEDLLYYTLFSLEQLEIAPSAVQALFYGETTPVDPYYKKAAQYLPNCSIYTPAHTHKIPNHLLEQHFDTIILNA